MTRYALLLLAFATAARADVWQDAVAHGRPDPNRDVFNSDLEKGDGFAAQSLARDIRDHRRIRKLVDDAVAAYRDAASAEPNEAEPYFRIAMILYSHYFDCDDPARVLAPSILCDPNPHHLDRARAQQVIEAWSAAEARAPLDPRFTVVPEIVPGESGTLFHRAILETKLADTGHLEAAMRDYESYLARGESEMGNETVMNNLAETYMMLDRLDDAIDMYRLAISRGSVGDTAFGLAVALDRDGRGQEAIAIILHQGPESYYKFIERVGKHETFFVPEGEGSYYFALLDEAFSRNGAALDEWERYIKSGAHPEFQPRAKQHIEALKKIPIQYPHWEPDPFGRMAP